MTFKQITDEIKRMQSDDTLNFRKQWINRQQEVVEEWPWVNMGLIFKRKKPENKEG